MASAAISWARPDDDEPPRDRPARTSGGRPDRGTRRGRHAPSARTGWGCGSGRSVGVGEQAPHLMGERVVGAGLRRAASTAARAARLAQLADRRRLERLEPVQHGFVGPEVAALDAAEHEVHRDEDDVDERDRRLEEVVDVAGDELPELVDEPPEPAAADERDERAVVGREERDREDDRDRHHQRAPDRVRDVQRAVAELRVAGDDQEDAVADHRPTAQTRNRSSRRPRSALRSANAARIASGPPSSRQCVRASTLIARCGVRPRRW